MRIFRSIGFALAMACGALLGAVSMAVEPVLRFASIGFEAMACGVQKLKRELAHQFGIGVEEATGVGAGWRAESNGYRQGSAHPMVSRVSTPI